MNAYLAEGRRLLRDGEYAEAIRSLAWAHDVEPNDVAIFLALIEAYEKCAQAEKEADAEKSADLLHQAFNVCRDLRDRRLPMAPGEQAAFFHAFVRVRDGLVAARRAGWTPPPPKEQAHTLFARKSGGD
jgi:hypothetical protein